MADNELLDDDVGGGDDIFVYTGGEQEVPFGVKRVRIAENVDTISRWSFDGCRQLIEVEGHNRLKKIEQGAFDNCTSLRRVTKMRGVIEMETDAFSGCSALSELEFDKLEIIGEGTFAYCKLGSINLPSIKRIGEYAFGSCHALTDVVFGKDLEVIEESAFYECPALTHIVIPLKDGLIVEDEAFCGCQNLSRVNILDGEIHKIISSLHLESWRNAMQEVIDRINQLLPDTPAIEKGEDIQVWIESVHRRMEHYKGEHQTLLKEAMVLLELALWKAKLLNEGEEKKCKVNVVAKKARSDTEAARKEHRVTCGASIVIKNVLPFLALK
jgi:hypothetical protein